MSEGQTTTPEIEKYLDRKSSIQDSEKLEAKSIDKIPEALRIIGEEVSLISGAWNPVEFYTASNTRDEKARFLDSFEKGERYNPAFEYKGVEGVEISDARAKLSEIYHNKLLTFQPTTQLERIARVALRYKILDDLATCDLVEGIQEKNEEKIKNALNKKYPGTDPVLMEQAVESFRNSFNTTETIRGQGRLSEEEKSWLENQEFDAEEIKEAFNWALDAYGILKDEKTDIGFQITISQDATSIDVRDKSANGSTIFIPADRKITGDKLLRLIAHEIEGHVRQSVNGQELFGLGGGTLKIDNEMLYEGLGMRNEAQVTKDLFGTPDSGPKGLFPHAVKMAEEGSDFYDIFVKMHDMELHRSLKVPLETPLPEEIHEELSKSARNSAWQTTYRVMRGHIDTSNKVKFAMAKDLAYFRGWLMDKQLRDNDLGAVNESAVIASDALPLIAHFHIEEEDLPHPYLNLARKYWEDKLKSKFQEEQNSS